MQHMVGDAKSQQEFAAHEHRSRPSAFCTENIVSRFHSLRQLGRAQHECGLAAMLLKISEAEIRAVSLKNKDGKGQESQPGHSDREE